MRVGLLAMMFAAGCTARALEIPLDGFSDLASADLNGVDLNGVDLASFDLAGADLAGDMATPPPNHCPAGTEFIFTIDANGTLSRFDPVNAQFFDVGPIACPAEPGDTPNSMAIDRGGNGYVNFQSGNLFRLITDTAECTSTPYVPGQFGVENVGMSFAENSPGSTDETLFVTPTTFGSSQPSSLATINVNTFKVTKPIQLATDLSAELTGDNDANLWGFFPDAALPFIARIDKKTGAFDMQHLLPAIAGSPQAWGFAAWQSDFYVFLERDSDPSTSVYHVDGTTGAVDTVLTDTGREIVGVGVATCAGNDLDAGIQ